MNRRIAAALSSLLLAALCASSGVPQARVEYYYGDGSGPTPAVTGTFIQPWLCKGWSGETWDAHLRMLLAAGIDTVVLQWTAETPGGEFSFAGFPAPSGWAKSASGFEQDGATVEGLLKSAQKMGVKVFLGLNMSDEWWNGAFSQKDWRDKQAAAANAVARELYRLYKAEYPDAFHGWYWPWEMYGNRSGYEKPWSEMMNGTLDFLTGLDGTLPVLFSPFMSSYIRLGPQEEQRMWAGFLASAHLRSGDIFCPQDSAGAAGFSMGYIDARLAAMKVAAGTKPGVLFWVNNENFTKDYKPATLDRFVSQLYVSGRYADTHLCFSYSHYYNPLAVNPSFDRDYKAFVATGGQVDRTPPAPPLLTADVSVDKKIVTLTVTPADDTDFHVIKLYNGNRLIDTCEVNDAVSGHYWYSKAFEMKKGGDSEYHATVMDCWGNVSDKAYCRVGDPGS